MSGGNDQLDTRAADTAWNLLRRNAIMIALSCSRHAHVKHTQPLSLQRIETELEFAERHPA